MTIRSLLLFAILFSCLFNNAHGQASSAERQRKEAVSDSLSASSQTIMELRTTIVELTQSNIEFKNQVQSLNERLEWLTWALAVLVGLQLVLERSRIFELAKSVWSWVPRSYDNLVGLSNRRRDSRRLKKAQKRRFAEAATQKSTSTLPAKTLSCMECGNEFMFSGDEQEFYSQRGFKDPKRCKECREKRKGEDRRAKRSRV